MSTTDDENSSFSDIDPSLSQSDVITTDEPSLIMERVPEKDKGIEVPPLPKFTVYAAMQLVGLLALTLGCFLMYLELKSYNFEKDVPAGVVSAPKPDLPPPPPIPKGEMPQGDAAPTAGAASPASSPATSPSTPASPTP